MYFSINRRSLRSSFRSFRRLNRQRWRRQSVALVWARGDSNHRCLKASNTHEAAGILRNTAPNPHKGLRTGSRTGSTDPSDRFNDIRPGFGHRHPLNDDRKRPAMCRGVLFCPCKAIQVWITPSRCHICSAAQSSRIFLDHRRLTVWIMAPGTPKSPTVSQNPGKLSRTCLTLWQKDIQPYEVPRSGRNHTANNFSDLNSRKDISSSKAPNFDLFWPRSRFSGPFWPPGAFFRHPSIFSGFKPF